LESLTAFAWDQLLALLVVYAALTLLGEDLSDRLRRRLQRASGFVASTRSQPLPVVEAPHPSPFPHP
jgi:hypothetical protein